MQRRTVLGSGVAQVSNLPYRRLPVGRLHLLGRVCGLEIRDTADWKSALRRAPGPRGRVAQVSNLPYRRLPVGRLHLPGRICGLEIRDTADWKSALRLPVGCAARVSNLSCRRLPVGRLYLLGRICGLEIRDTADWKSALRLPAGEARELSGLAPMPFGNCLAPAGGPCPGGISENSPAFQRWVLRSSDPKSRRDGRPPA